MKNNILIIDDEIKISRNLKQQLSEEDYEITVAQDGNSGLEAIKSGSFDLIITDLFPEDVDGCNIMDFISEHSPETLVIVMTAHASVESVVTALRSGAYDYIVKPVRMEIVKQIVRRACDRIELQKHLMEATRQLHLLAITDALTGLYNLRYFKERLTEEFERTKRYAQPLSCVMIDLDGFKQINDTYGHLEGDKLLKDVSRIIKKSIRSSDLLARYGGDEFVLLLPQTPSDKACLLAERIQKAITNNLSSSYQEHGSSLTISLGISTLPNPDINEEEELVSFADRALYAAKRAGRNRIEILAD